MFLTTVPKTAVYKNRDFRRPKDNISFPIYRLHWPDIDSVAQAAMMKDSSNIQFAFGITSLLGLQSF